LQKQAFVQSTEPLVTFKNLFHFWIIVKGETKMFLLIHALVGGTIGLYFHSAALIILIGILSHFLLDTVPHCDVGFDREHFKIYSEAKFKKNTVYLALLDIAVTGVFILILHYHFHIPHITLGAFAAIIPDLASIGYFTRLKHKAKYKRYLHFHNNLQRDAGFISGILTQLAVFIVFMKILM
jgi:hypothetical protein